MRFDVFTLFPDYFCGPLSTSILARAREKNLIEVGLHDIRGWTTDKHRIADDAPFGGGAGMVMKAEPVARALEDVLNFTVGISPPPCPIVYLSPQGRTLNQKVVNELAAQPRLALLCGHYEGVDERVIQSCVSDEISLGDFVLTGGEGAAAILIEAVARWVPEVLGNRESAPGDSFANGLLETPYYTRPAQWRGRDVPEILMSGHHARIEEWRFRQGVERTLQRRPDLIEKALQNGALSPQQRQICQEMTVEKAKAEASESPDETEKSETE